LRLSK
ncbi:hypothetical protein MPH_12910, partial [Macrophomina phaseolina MS6]